MHIFLTQIITKNTKSVKAQAHGRKDTHNIESLPHDSYEEQVTLDTLPDGPSVYINQNEHMATTFIDKTQKHVAKDEDPYSSAHLQQIPLYIW